MKEGHYRPPEVEKARKERNREALSAMGTKGGIHTGLMRADEKAQNENELKKLTAEHERLYHIDEDGDVLPPDQNIIASLEE